MGYSRLTSGVCSRFRSSRRIGEYVADFPRLAASPTAAWGPQLPSHIGWLTCLARWPLHSFGSLPQLLCNGLAVVFGPAATEQVQQPPTAVVQCIPAMVV